MHRCRGALRLRLVVVREVFDLPVDCEQRSGGKALTLRGGRGQSWQAEEKLEKPMIASARSFARANDEAFGGEESDLFAGSACAEDGEDRDCDVAGADDATGSSPQCSAEVVAAAEPPPSVFDNCLTTIASVVSARAADPASPSYEKARAEKALQPSTSSSGRSQGAGGHEPRRPEKKVAKKTAVGRWVRKVKVKQRDHVLYWLDTKYDVLPEAINAVKEDWQEAAGPDEDVDLFWSDGAISTERFAKMKPYQKVNHFVGMTSITRKNNLGRNLLRMKRRFPEEYRFFPDTWILPTDLPDFKAQFTGKRNKTFIVKPSDGYQGKGIFLTRDFENIPVDYNSTLVVQRYIHRPYLLQGHKFDLRLYVLVTGCDPLRIFLHQQGLVRLASEEYMEPKGKNLGRSMMHLTNYAINVENPNFEENTNPDDGSDGHKRSLQAVLAELEAAGVNIAQMMYDIEELVIKTLVAVQPSLSHVYRCCQPDDVENAMCFEILGFDVLIDHEAKPWLIEVNHAPSFRTDSKLDHIVKFEVLKDAFELLNINPDARRRYVSEQQQMAEDRARGVAIERRTPMERAALEEGHAKARYEWESSVKNGYKRIFPRVLKGFEHACVSGTQPAFATAVGAPTQPTCGPSGVPENYDRYAEAAVDIWEMLTGSWHSRKQAQQNEKAEEKSASTASGAKRAPAENSKKADGAARAPARQRPCDRGRSGGSATSSGQAQAAASAVDDSCSITLGGPSASSTPPPAAGDAGGAPGGAAKTRSQSAEKPPLPSAGAFAVGQRPWTKKNAEFDVGDLIHVQTNMGWEAVMIRKKYESGHLDIEFTDGELMREVMPRILRRTGATSSRPGSRLANVSGSPAAADDSAEGAHVPESLPSSSLGSTCGTAASMPLAGTAGAVSANAHATQATSASPMFSSALFEQRRRTNDDTAVTSSSGGMAGQAPRIRPKTGTRHSSTARRAYLHGRLPPQLLPETQRLPLAIEARGLHPLSILPGVGG